MNTPWWFGRCGLVGGGLVVTLFSACKKSDGGPPADTSQVAAAPAVAPIPCAQHEPISIPSRDTLAALTFVKVNQLQGPGGISQIPEFHDCQRLITKDGTYGPTAGVFADSLVGSSLDSVLAREGSDQPAIQVAVVLSEGNFHELDIIQGYNCVYLFRKGGQLWWFMHQPADNSSCPPNLAIEIPNYRVAREAATLPFDASDFSPSARWDYDRGKTKERQFIGLPCGNAYCMYGKPPVHSSYVYDRNGDRANRRPWVARTWYDEQLLGVVDSPGSPIRLSPVFGTVFPVPGLGERDDAAYEGSDHLWVQVAEIKMTEDLPQYRTTFGLMRTGVNETNKVYFCKGDATRCFPPSGDGAPARCKVPLTPSYPWYAMIISPKADTTYRCVTYHEHKGFPIPGNARWWWTPVDEGVWARCPNGCCQVS